MLIPLVASIPLLVGHTDCGHDHNNPAPALTGDWRLTYADDLTVDINIGGTVYHDSIGPQGGSVTIDHHGQPITFDLDCARPEVVCPSEVWADTVTLNQKQPNFPRRVWLTIPQQSCDGALVAPEPSECGSGTNNPDCEQVCTGTVTNSSTETFGLVTADGGKLEVLLGAGVASNGANCIALAVSGASAELVATGSADDDTWVATELANGEIATGYAGGCLWAGDSNDDGSIEALVLNAAITLRTSFSGQRAQ